MIVAPLPENEEERIAALKSYAILDTEAEQDYDQLTRLAALVCNVPIALVSLVDADRQWFKSCIGLDATETGRDIAFCSHAILGTRIFEIQDASKDDRFSDNPLVTGPPNIRFYAGTPLIDSANQALGTLCLIDRVPKKLSVIERKILSVLGQQAVTQMEYQRALADIARKTLELDAAEKSAQSAKQRAEKANQAKSDFLANMSHELRTPLNAIIGFSEMLAEDAEINKQQQSLEDLQKIIGSGRHLLELINDVLDLSKAEAGKVELDVRHFSPEELVKEVTTITQPLIEKNNNILETNIALGLGNMISDPLKLRQVLFNLISNAAKFTDNGVISLSVQYHPGDETNGQVEFIVKDTGIGMDDKVLNDLFEPFVQADNSRTGEFGGTGLGLAISKKYIELMGGEINVVSQPGKGSTFRVSLPFDLKKPTSTSRSQQAGAEPARASAIAEPGKATILIIDDEADARELLTHYLTDAGWQVVSTSNGPEGIKLARELKPAAITLDVLMNGMDGWSVLEVLKADDTLSQIPIIMCTVVDEKQRGFSLGATDYMVKPIQRAQLLDTLKRFSNGAMKHLLLVEDDANTRDMMARTARKQGWSVSEAGDGKQALDCLRQDRPDLVLLDLMMPEMDGFELIEAMRVNADWRDIPVIVVTAKDLTQEDHRRLNGYVEEILGKEQMGPEGLLEQVSKRLNMVLKKPKQ